MRTASGARRRLGVAQCRAVHLQQVQVQNLLASSTKSSGPTRRCWLCAASSKLRVAEAQYRRGKVGAGCAAWRAAIDGGGRWRLWSRHTCSMCGSVTS